MKNKGFLIAMIIFGTPFLVISLSTFWYYAGLGPKATVNYGTMINPPVDLGSLELELDYQPLNIDSMERKWMIGRCSSLSYASINHSARLSFSSRYLAPSAFVLSGNHASLPPMRMRYSKNAHRCLSLKSGVLRLRSIGL